MNFLLHHVFATRELADAEHVELAAVGAMLPDLFRMALGGRRRRPRGEPEHDAAVAPEVSALLRGSAHHVEIDRWFHGADPFVRGERDLRRAFLLPDSTKLVLFAHAAWEMCLDGAWLRRASASEVDRLRGAARAMPFVFEAARAEGVLDGMDERAIATFRARMQRIFEAFEDGTIHAAYLHAEGVARRVAGVRAAFGLGVPAPATLDTWTEALTPFVTRADEELDALLRARSG